MSGLRLRDIGLMTSHSPDRYDENSDLRHSVMSQQETQAIEHLVTSLERMGWESFVKNRLPLLKLPEVLLNALREGKIEYTKARAIALVKDEDKRQELLQAAISENLSTGYAVPIYAFAITLRGANKPRTIATKINAGTSPSRCPRSCWSITACTAMISPWTILDQTVNQIKLRCASGFREAHSKKIPSVA
jgi:HTH domain found in ParB protein